MLKFILLPGFVFVVLLPLTAAAKPGGCLKYGAAGAVAGHYAGHHGVMGAVAGCALGIHKRREYKREMRMQQQSAAPTPRQQSVAPATPQSTY